MLSVLLLVCAPYAAVAVGYAEARRRGEAPPRWARIAGPTTAALHLAALVALGRATGKSPFQTESQALSFLAFSVAGLYVVLEATSRLATYGGRFHLLTALLCGASVPGLSSEPLGAPGRAADVAFSLHVGFALLGTAAIVAGGLLAAGYLGAYRRMKRGDLTPDATAGPSLFGLQRIARDASLAGVLLLTPSIALGREVLARVASGNTAWAVAELLLAGVQVALSGAAAFVWWRRPHLGPAAAWLNVAATAVAVLSLTIVHPHMTSAAAP